MDLFRRLFNQPGQHPEQKTEETLIPNTSIVEKSAAEPTGQTPAVEVPRPRNTVADGATRPLPPLETVVSSSSEHLIFGQSTDVGMVRSNNQDSMLSFFSTSRSAESRPDFGLFVVADGMGGHHDGEKASAMSVRTLASNVMSNVYLPLMGNDDGSERPPISESMVSAVKKANEDVVAAIPEGGTTLTAVAVIGDLAYVVHVGDSRAYLITDTEIEQITRDHSLVQRLVELDQLTQEETLDHPQRNVLYRALGQSESLEVDTLTRRLPPNSRLLLCSDGLWNQISESEIGEIVRKHADPQEACDKLVALANAHGGADNITAVLLQIPQ